MNNPEKLATLGTPIEA